MHDEVHDFVASLKPDAPLGFFTVDVDYYSSALGCLEVPKGQPDRYLPHFWAYFDDVTMPSANRWCGELLAIDEFNLANQQRKIDNSDVLRSRRVFKNSDWLEIIRSVHILDHPARQEASSPQRSTKMTHNAALGIKAD